MTTFKCIWDCHSRQDDNFHNFSRTCSRLEPGRKEGRIKCIQIIRRQVILLFTLFQRRMNFSQEKCLSLCICFQMHHCHHDCNFHAFIACQLSSPPTLVLSWHGMQVGGGAALSWKEKWEIHDQSWDALFKKEKWNNFFASCDSILVLHVRIENTDEIRPQVMSEWEKEDSCCYYTFKSFRGQDKTRLLSLFFTESRKWAVGFKRLKWLHSLSSYLTFTQHAINMHDWV